jgi:methionyl-tRNA formyltransferase
MLNIRTATLSDLNTYYNWANDPEVRDSAIHSEKIDYATHIEWFSKKLESSKTILFICHLKSTPFGQVRFDIDKNGEVWIDYSIDPQFRGQGLSTFMLRSSIIKLLILRSNIQMLKAVVKTSNNRSAKVFEKLGFIESAQEEINDINCIVYMMHPSPAVKYVVANTNPIYHQVEKDLFEKYKDVYFIRSTEDLSYESVQQLQPEYIFFLHWSHLIRPEIYKNFESVVFHMTDLPYGRGGSPLQNLIIRKCKTTKLSALKVNEGLDTGDIYLKRELELHGTAEEIFIRAGALMEEMIAEIIESKPVPQPQQGEPVVFKRRKPEESNIINLDSLEDVFDHIRMLDAEGYPNAFIETDHFRFEFSKASLQKDQLQANVRIFKK